MRGTRPLRRRAVLALGLAALIATAVVGATGIPVNKQVREANAPDLILYNGEISTMDATNSSARAMAIRDGKIIAIDDKNGRIRALADDSTTVVNLNGRRVLPGLIDGTLHGVRNSYHCFGQAVRHELNYTRSAALAAYAARGAEHPDDTWVFTTAGWNVNQLDVPGMFTKAELDAALPSNPVMVQGNGFSGMQVNSRALQLLGLGPGSPGVELDPSGQPTGRLTQPASGMVNRAIGTQLEMNSIDRQADCLAEFMRAANRAGLTAWDDPGGNDPFDPQGRAIEALREGHGFQAINELHRQGRMTARVVLHLTSFGGLATVQRDTRHAFSLIGDDMLRIGGPGEEIMFAVGGVYPLPEYQEIVNYLAQNRWNFQHHASLGITQRTMLDAWEQANAIHPIADLNWAMLHPHEGPENPTTETLARIQALGAAIVPTDSNVQGAGDEHPPYRRIYESGARSCLGTDAMNAGPYAPFINIWYTISGRTLQPGATGVVPEQRLTREEALRMATSNCASIIDLEGKVGLLEPGKYADLIVLSDDYFTVPTDDIRTLTSVLTVVDGKVVYADAEFAALDD
jgi:predicted amidohydrolase YtcJ